MRDIANVKMRVRFSLLASNNLLLNYLEKLWRLKMRSCEKCMHSSLRDNGLEYDWLMCDCLESDFYDTEVEDELDTPTLFDFIGA